ncbi:hypothetical protein [Leucobacter sp. W1153]|uniref:hypothetical protein n=1 Tax=unclassified Leucobacter TaxID=2621730 RepID=UPI003F2F6503
MSTLREPVGPKDKTVYMRRRILVLAALLAVIAAVVLVIVKPGSSGGATGARQVEVPEDLVTVEQEETAAADPAAIAPCADSQLRVTPVTDRSSYASGELPGLSLSVENIGEADCQADLGTAAMRFEITSGADQVWRSTDCQENADHRAVIVQPGKPLSTETLVWDRTRSSPESCEITRDPVGAGGATYHLRVAVGGVNGEGTAPFLLY